MARLTLFALIGRQVWLTRGVLNIHLTFVGALGTTLPGTPVAHFAAGSVPASGTSTSVFVVVFPHSL